MLTTWGHVYSIAEAAERRARGSGARLRAAAVPIYFPDVFFRPRCVEIGRCFFFYSREEEEILFIFFFFGGGVEAKNQSNNHVAPSSRSSGCKYPALPLSSAFTFAVGCSFFEAVSIFSKFSQQELQLRDLICRDLFGLSEKNKLIIRREKRLPGSAFAISR